jgi:hypothetical protein
VGYGTLRLNHHPIFAVVWSYEAAVIYKFIYFLRCLRKLVNFFRNYSCYFGCVKVVIFFIIKPGMYEHNICIPGKGN